MKLNVFLLVVVIACSVSACQSAVITPDRAEAAVRVFEHNSSLNLTTPVLKQNVNPKGWVRLDTYTMKHLDAKGSSDSDWSVDAATGEVLVANHKYDEMYSEKPIGPKTEKDCQQIASDFAHKHYSGFKKLNMKSYENVWFGIGWLFQWHETLPSGATTPNRVWIMVNPVSGKIQEYHVKRIPTPNPPKPKLSARQAIEAVAKHLKWKEVGVDDTPKLSADPLGTYWNLSVSGISSDGTHDTIYECMAQVNAVTGKVTISCMSQGAEMARIAPRGIKHKATTRKKAHR